MSQTLTLSTIALLGHESRAKILENGLTKDQILAEAKSLDAAERDELIEDLRQEDGELSEEQMTELRRRLAALDRGETKAPAR